MGMRSKRKGYRIEHEIVERLRAVGIPAERVPLSGAAGGTFAGDIKIGIGNYRAEVKGRGEGAGFKMLERWLGSNELLFLKRDRTEPLVVMEWHAFLSVMKLALEGTPKQTPVLFADLVPAEAYQKETRDE